MRWRVGATPARAALCGADDTARPDAEVEAGQCDADSAAQPVAGGAGGAAQERPASQREVETLVLEPPRAGVEGAMEEELVLRAPTVEETRVPEPARFGDDGAAAAETAQTTPKNVLPFVELPQSSEEYEDSGDINPVAASPASLPSSGRPPRR